ncbi:glycoside hydrolase family 71/99-like protein [Streptomyces sp. RS2]|uniref:glycoside hydrolase family 71/99-like protein n=1 Tax=Streptomyces sp. RS2 TaxID=1451205 RepID=UPI0021F8F35D|nr:glycoside hydrolase family 71/99-like protein [Streptomyces sp. RS2]MCW1100231.1 glycoside hydrolase family 71/99-like protein [Streptomyces sp. RS2]
MSDRGAHSRRNFLRGTGALGVGAAAVWAGAANLPTAGAEPTGPEPAPRKKPFASGGVKGKVYVGYQGWFACAGDGSPINTWTHWSTGKTPSPGNQTFELYPDISAYSASSLHLTGYAKLGNGKPAQLFASHATDVIDQHFDWMKQHDIDGAALQRFGSDVTAIGQPRLQQRNEIQAKARAAAEKHGVGFYLEYDISGFTDANLVSALQRDWTDTINGTLKLPASPSYAREGGKPVVHLWGLGFTNRPGTVESSLEIINWFKNQGCYVIGGVPRGWRTDANAKPGFGPVYAALDMLSPWNVGNPTVDQKAFDDDMARLKANGQAYQPVIYPGFAWSNWKVGAPRNEIPRKAGDFMWQQAVAAARCGTNSAFIAMFDEYDEATAIAPAATDKSMIPTDQYFLTLDADGTKVSSDFYLRLAGAATKMINGSAEISPTVPIPPIP